MKHYEGLLMASYIAHKSNCKRRKIGAAILDSSNTYICAANKAAIACEECHRDTCPAVHAEVGAIQNAYEFKALGSATTMYVWAEVPCHQCLSFIKLHSDISIIYCLTPESYSVEYKLSEGRLEDIVKRREYAKNLNISIIEIDRKEVLDYELS